MGCSIPLNQTLSKQMMKPAEKQYYAKQSALKKQSTDLRQLLNLTLNEGKRIQEDRLIKYLLQRIPRKYYLDKILNYNSSGLVFKAIQIKTQIPFAIKIISKPLSIDEHSHIRKYLEIFNALSNNCCIRTYEQFMIERNIYIVMDYFELGTLHNYLMKQDKRLQEGTIKNIMLSLCLAVKHIHSKGIVHRNLKPSNIFLRDDVVFDLVIGGFGQADFCQNKLNRGSEVQEFRAQDVIKVNDYQIDIYSLGTICFLLFNVSLHFLPVLNVPSLFQVIQLSSKLILLHDNLNYERLCYLLLKINVTSLVLSDNRLPVQSIAQNDLLKLTQTVTITFTIRQQAYLCIIQPTSRFLRAIYINFHTISLKSTCYCIQSLTIIHKYSFDS